MAKKFSFIESVKLFNKTAGTEEKFDVRKAALYTGLVLEEVGELLESFQTEANKPNELLLQVNMLVGVLDNIASKFKNGTFDELIPAIDRVEFLDAAVDIMVVAAGAGISSGSDLEGAAQEVCESNLSKFKTADGKGLEVLKDENGKIKKGPLYFRPELAKFVKE